MPRDPPPTKFCVHCHWCARSISGAVCLRPESQLSHPDYLVFGPINDQGDPAPIWMRCASMRIGPICGPNANLFEPKENSGGNEGTAKNKP